MPAWSGLYNNVHGQDHTLINQQSAVERDIARQLRKPGLRSLRGAIRALNGTVVGGATATESYRRVVAVQGLGSNSNLGGVRATELVNDINRTTVTADKARIDAINDAVFTRTSPPVDRSGNGGGGKVGRF